MISAKNIVKLKQKKYRHELGCFVVEGKVAVLEAAGANAPIQQLIVSDHLDAEYAQQPAVQSLMQRVPVLRVNQQTFSHMVDTVTPQGIAAIITTPTTTLKELAASKLIAVLEDIRDPGNLGTIIRTADWFGVDGIVLLGGADPYQPKTVRSSMGSLFHLPILVAPLGAATLLELKKTGFEIIVTRPELAGQKATPLTPATKRAVIFGNEAHGTSAALDEVADQVFSIPQFGKAESLNVAVSFGIVLYELHR